MKKEVDRIIHRMNSNFIISSSSFPCLFPSRLFSFLFPSPRRFSPPVGKLGPLAFAKAAEAEALVLEPARVCIY